MAEDRNNSQRLVRQAHTVRNTKRSCQTSIRFILVSEAGKRALSRHSARVGREEIERIESLSAFPSASSPSTSFTSCFHTH